MNNLTEPNDIFDRMKAGEAIRKDDPEYSTFQQAVARTIRLSAALNVSTDIDQVREQLSDITGSVIDESTIIFPPFYTNFGTLNAFPVSTATRSSPDLYMRQAKGNLSSEASLRVHMFVDCFSMRQRNDR